MAGLASAVLGVTLLLCAGSARAGDFFTGVQLDSEAQYFSYLGLKADLPWESSGYQSFVQLFVTAQSYEYESGEDEIDVDVQAVVPSIGVSRSIRDGAWNFSLLLGPEIEWKRERGFADDEGRASDVGVLVQAEAHYWQETRSLQTLLSYASLDDFFFGRIRGKTRFDLLEERCCSLYAGLDLAGMGNDDYEAIQFGPVIEVPIDRFSLSVRGGYQHDSNVGSGGYGGIELYAPF